MELEARLLQVPAAGAVARVDARDVVHALAARRMGHVLAAGEVIVLRVGAHELRLRVAAADALDATARVRSQHTRNKHEQQPPDATLARCCSWAHTARRRRLWATTPTAAC